MNELYDMVNEFGAIHSSLQSIICIILEIESHAEDTHEEMISSLFSGVKYYLEHLENDMSGIIQKLDLYELKVRNKIAE